MHPPKVARPHLPKVERSNEAPRLRVTIASFDCVQRPLSVLIAGAGIAGPALAYWLTRRGHRPVLVERLDGLRVGGHAVDIRGTALDVVDRMGVGDAVRDARTRILTLSAVRPDGRCTYDVALRPLHEARGDREIEVMRDDLVDILFGAVTDDVDVVFGDAIRAVTQRETSVGVEFEHGPSREFDVVVGADGQHSALRELAFGPEGDYIRHLGAYLSIYTIDNLLNLSDQAVLYNEPGRGAAAFTVRGNARAKVVLMFRSGRIGIDYADRPAQQDLLRRRFAGMGWQTPRLIDALDGAHDFYFDEMAQVRMQRWSSGRIALLGDAAFGPSPMSGQGTSLALIGGYLLAHQLDSVPDVKAAFDRWENGFRASVEQNQRLAGDGFGMLLPGSRLGIAVRNQTMRALPALARLGLGFGGQLERASRSVTLPDV
jgi:2-polyprenyl-6-methoxyphenol hydroxylase-like FAD-dependent oxidoreductase